MSKRIFQVLFIVTIISFINYSLDTANSIVNYQRATALSNKYSSHIYMHDTLDNETLIPVMVSEAVNNNVLISKGYILYDSDVEYRFYSGNSSFNTVLNKYIPASKSIDFSNPYYAAAKPDEKQIELQFFKNRLVDDKQLVFASWDNIIPLNIPTPFVTIYGDTKDIVNWKQAVEQRLGVGTLTNAPNFESGEYNELNIISILVNKSFLMFFSSFLLLVLTIIIVIHQEKRRISIWKMHGFSSQLIAYRILKPYLVFSVIFALLILNVAHFMFVKNFNYLFLVMLLLEMILIIILALIFIVTYFIMLVFIEQVEIVSTIKKSDSYIKNYRFFGYMRILILVFLIPVLLMNIFDLIDNKKYYNNLNMHKSFYSKITHFNSFSGLGSSSAQDEIESAIREIYFSNQNIYYMSLSFAEMNNEVISIINTDYRTLELLEFEIPLETKTDVSVIIPERYKTFDYKKFLLEKNLDEHVLVMDDYTINYINPSRLLNVNLDNPIIYVYSRIDQIENLASFSNYYIIENSESSIEMILKVKDSLRNNTGDMLSIWSLGESVRNKLYFLEESIKINLRGILYTGSIIIILQFTLYYLYIYAFKKNIAVGLIHGKMYSLFTNFILDQIILYLILTISFDVRNKLGIKSLVISAILLLLDLIVAYLIFNKDKRTIVKEGI